MFFYSLFGVFGKNHLHFFLDYWKIDRTDAEQEASAYNKGQLEHIEENIQSTQSVVNEKMDEL